MSHIPSSPPPPSSCTNTDSPENSTTGPHNDIGTSVPTMDDDKGDDWDFKLATLFSIFESTPEHVLHRALVDAKGDLEQAIPLILSSNSDNTDNANRRNNNDIGNTGNGVASSIESAPSSSEDPSRRKRLKLIQPRLSAFLPTTSSPASLLTPQPEPQDLTLPSLNDRLRWKEPLDDSPTLSPSAQSSSSSSIPITTQKPPKPVIFYNPDDVAKHCPCTLIFNVLSKDLAARLLQAMLIDSESWNRNRWWLFERMVESSHKTSYFAERDDDMEEVSSWTYNGMRQDPPRRFLKEMEEAKFVVRRIVNEQRKTRTIHPYEVQGDWNCNVAAVNHYAHSKECVGWHADKLTYLGPRPTIGSLTLGATRFFRIRKIVPDVKNPESAGQLISIALPHNSLCIMWPPMQEEWKHEIPPQATVTPHPISGTARINITFRLRREGFSPAETPVCKCGVAMVLRCVFKSRANYGRYFYMCYASGSQEGRTCGAFQWVDMEEKLKLTRPSKSLSSSSSSNPDDEETANSSQSASPYLDHGDIRQEHRSQEPEQHGLNLADELEDADLTDFPLEDFSERDFVD